MRRHQFIKERTSTRERFIRRSQQRRHGEEEPSSSTWFRKRSNFFVLLMILVIFALLFIVKSVYQVQDTQQNASKSPVEESEMTYEEAKRIFSGTADP